MRNLAAAIAGIGCLVFSLVGCDNPVSSNKSPLVGTWNLTVQTVAHSSTSRVDTNTAGPLFSNKYEFNTDYSLNVTANLLGMPIGMSGTWSATADSVTLTISGSSAETWGYKISGSELAMSRSETGTGGTTLTTEYYTKQ
jgi:hypothetical protein